MDAICISPTVGTSCSGGGGGDQHMDGLLTLKRINVDAKHTQPFGIIQQGRSQVVHSIHLIVVYLYLRMPTLKRCIERNIASCCLSNQTAVHHQKRARTQIHRIAQSTESFEKNAARLAKAAAVLLRVAKRTDDPDGET